MPSTRITRLRAKAAARSMTHPDTQTQTQNSPEQLNPAPSGSVLEPLGPKRSQRSQKKSFKGACLEVEKSKRNTRSKRCRRTRARNLKVKQANQGLDSSQHDSSSPDPDPFATVHGDETAAEEPTHGGPGNGTQWETIAFIPFPPSPGQETLAWLQDNQAPSVAAPQRQASYNLLSGVPLSAGGGFHLNHPARHDSGVAPNLRHPSIPSTTLKRLPDTAPDDLEPSKRARPSQVPDSDTATESEEDFPALNHHNPNPPVRSTPVGIVAPPPGPPMPTLRRDTAPASPRPASLASQPPTPVPHSAALPSVLRESVVPETPEPMSPAPPSPVPVPSQPEHQPEDELRPLDPGLISDLEPDDRASSHSLGGSYTPGSRPTSERLRLTGYTTPPKSPSRRVRLRELVKKERRQKTQVVASGRLLLDMPEYVRFPARPSYRPDPAACQTNAHLSSRDRQGHVSQPPSGGASQIPAPKPPHTYSGPRSHCGSQPDAHHSQSANHGPPLLAGSQLAPQCPVTPVSGMQRSTNPQQAPGPHVNHGRLRQGANGPMLPPHMPLAAQIRRHRPSTPRPTSPGPSAPPRHGRGHPNPASDVRTKTAAYNKQYSRKLATSLVESVTHDVRGVPTTPVQPEETLPDNAEARMHAVAAANGTRPCRRGRKPKPLARDTVGVARHILALAKRHLFALALLEGVYPTRGLALFWAGIVYEETWRSELPDVPFEEPTEGMLEVLVNYIPTLRGGVKYAMRTVVEKAFGFNDHPETDNEIESNLKIYRTISNNAFHCASFSPREGHYENSAIGRAIAAAFFDTPGSVGRLYPDYFEEMDLPIPAFVLAMMEFCIEEWSTGSRQERDLNTGRMPERFETHKKNLENAKVIFPGRLRELQEYWFAICSNHNAPRSRTEQVAQGIIPLTEFRPDTPEPEPEYDSDGRLTARSKGKGPAR